MFNTEKHEKINELVSSALGIIDSKYGQFSSDYKPYHNAEHTRDVISATQQIGSLAVKNLIIVEDDLALLKLAAAYHDIVHGLKGRDSEDASIEVIVSKMSEDTSFNKNDITKITEMINSTVTNSIRGVFSQSAGHDYLGQIMADSDLCALGSEFEIYWDRSQKYYFENNGLKYSEISKEQQNRFLNFQIEFLLNHNYYTSEAKSIFNHKPENIDKLKKLISI